MPDQTPHRDPAARGARTELPDRWTAHVRAVTVEEALYLNRTALDGETVVLVSTMQAFNVAQKDYLGTPEMMAAVAEYGYSDAMLPGDKSTEWVCANR